ncbi:conserved hypothetical protein [Solidesulfovibrio fructosivorans JJ]]|uniref:Uncharacterized protein n=1 Tax=Solidesulfovibrio fructosivorans JJ] TaxID=596151 RepID=E1JZY4_SOLFR|nr:hypothetical protein [Solidesulfovibrio fructosivorans]EFL50079.1 conserved hypothetical protein [Solidesulfovibrio fructosivorans JJ]]
MQQTDFPANFLPRLAPARQRPPLPPGPELSGPARLCFDRGDYELLGLVADVWSRRDSPGLRGLLASYLHPHGIKEMAAPRAMRLAYAIIRLIGSLDAGLADVRLRALRCLRDEATAIAGTGLEKNTARVLLEIMKRLVRAGDDRRRQLELAHDFRAAVPGNPRVVRRLLAEHHLLEMPEEWNQVAFDDHVHDAATKGRKSPTHLILDAWIKGIRRLTVIHYHHVHPDTAAELLAAADIMEMEVAIGIELLARHDGRPVKFLWTPEALSRPEESAAFLRDPAIEDFMRQGREISERFKRHALALLDAFNARHRPAINARFGLDLPPLSPDDFLESVGHGQPSPLHLARFVHERLEPLLAARGKDVQARTPSDEAALKDYLASLEALDVEALLDGWLSPEANPGLTAPEEAAPGETLPKRMRLSPGELCRALAELCGTHRLTLVAAGMDVADVLRLLFACRGAITHIEIFNLRVFETQKRDAADTLELLAILNVGDAVGLKERITRTAEKAEATGDAATAARLRELRPEVGEMTAAYRLSPLGVRMGSDSSGHSTRCHGMGLAVADTLPHRTRAHLAARAKKPGQSLRRVIPVGLAVSPRLCALPDDCPPGPLTRTLRRLGEWPLLRLGGYRWRLSWTTGRAFRATGKTANIHTLGGTQPSAAERFLEAAADAKPMRFRARYANGSLKNAAKIGIGFAVAAASFASTHSWWVLAYGGPFIWFGITGLRNLIQTAFGCGGLRRSQLLRWEDYVSIDRIADSLFFTGFSVPLLDVLVRSALLGHGLGITTATNPTALFTIMALANGLYLASHNLFRGLPRAAALGNLFRSVLSIPLAVGINFALAWVLRHAGAASPEAILEPFAAIVSKFASDCVAAVIEGLADRGRYLRLRARDYREKFRQLREAQTRLELLHPDADAASLLESPKKFLSGLESHPGGLQAIFIANALDFLYFWMYQPHARTVMARALRAMSLRERRIFLLSQYVLLREKEISRLFIDGLVGKTFAPALAFFLSNARCYLEDIQKLAMRLPPAETQSLENTFFGHDAPS